MTARSDVGGDVPARLAVAAPAYPDVSVTARTAARARLMDLRIARSRHLYHRSMADWSGAGVNVHCRHLAGQAHVRQAREAPRPRYGKIKAARCGPVGWLRKAGISAPCNEVHFSPQPAFSDNARRINARHASRLVARGQSAIRARCSVASRVFRPFGSLLVPWHTAAVGTSGRKK